MTTPIIGFWKIDEENGFMAQWYHSPFEENGVHFTCCEQYMMYHKAKLFGDDKTVAEVLKEKDPRNIKALGKKVRGFDGDVWDANKENIVLSGNLLKFKSNETLRRALMETGGAILVEASPFDNVWGIGQKHLSKPWKGQNLLGFILMRVRDTLRKET